MPTLERFPMPYWTPFDHPEVAELETQLFLAQERKGGFHPDTLELEIRLEEAYDRVLALIPPV